MAKMLRPSYGNPGEWNRCSSPWAAVHLSFRLATLLRASPPSESCVVGRISKGKIKKGIHMGKKEPRESLVVASKIKEYIKSKEMMSSGDLPEAVSEMVYDILERAIARASANGRQTVQPRDV